MKEYSNERDEGSGYGTLRVVIYGAGAACGKTILQFLLAGFLRKLGWRVRLCEYPEELRRHTMEIYGNTYKNRKKRIAPRDVIIEVHSHPTWCNGASSAICAPLEFKGKSKQAKTQ